MCIKDEIKKCLFSFCFLTKCTSNICGKEWQSHFISRDEVDSFVLEIIILWFILCMCRFPLLSSWSRTNSVFYQNKPFGCLQLQFWWLGQISKFWLMKNFYLRTICESWQMRNRWLHEMNLQHTFLWSSANLHFESDRKDFLFLSGIHVPCHCWSHWKVNEISVFAHYRWPLDCCIEIVFLKYN